jgi:L,D-transpeptidase catalytic domain
LKLIVRLALASAAVVIIGLLWTGLGGGDRQEAMTAALDSLPAAPAPALQVSQPEQLPSGRYLSRWTIVRAATSARSEPAANSPVIATLTTNTPDHTPNALTVLEAKTVAAGQLWVKVRLPVLPNGTAGWVRRRSLGAYQTVNTHLVLDRRRLLATLYRNGRLIFRAPVGIGTDSWPTPAGEFTVRSQLTRYASPFYGPVAFGTTARSAILTDWPGGGFVGIHGTNQPQLIPGRISHGCVRMRNDDILRLAALMPLGTPLTIR